MSDPTDPESCQAAVTACPGWPLIRSPRLVENRPKADVCPVSLCPRVVACRSSKPTAEPVYLPTDFSDGQLERRMSLSATSDSASSKRFLTPEDDSPQPAKRARPATVSLDNGSYPGSDSESIDHAKVQLPSIFHAFGEPFRHDQSRRASLPTDARVKAGDHLNVPRGTYPPSPLNSYQFPPQQDPHVDQTGRPRVDTQVTLGTYADHSPYPTTATTSATPSSYYGTSPMSSEYVIFRPHKTPR